MSGINNAYFEPVSNQVPARIFNDVPAQGNLSSPEDDWLAYPFIPPSHRPVRPVLMICLQSR